MHTNSSAHQRGLTITESLTALVLLAIGVLCIATVYLERTQAAPAVLLHSKANRLAEEMAEQLLQQRTDPVHFENPVGVRCDPRFTGVSAQKKVNNDIACWQEKVAQTLPNGSGAIAHESQMVPAYLITVSWSPPKRGTASYLLRVAAPNSVPAPRAEPKKTPPVKSAEAPRKPATSSLDSNLSLPEAATDVARAAN